MGRRLAGRSPRRGRLAPLASRVEQPHLERAILPPGAGERRRPIPQEAGLAQQRQPPPRRYPPDAAASPAPPPGAGRRSAPRGGRPGQQRSVAEACSPSWPPAGRQSSPCGAWRAERDAMSHSGRSRTADRSPSLTTASRALGQRRPRLLQLALHLEFAVLVVVGAASALDDVERAISQVGACARRRAPQPVFARRVVQWWSPRRGRNQDAGSPGCRSPPW